MSQAIPIGEGTGSKPHSCIKKTVPRPIYRQFNAKLILSLLISG